jgi:hypothetical protein
VLAAAHLAPHESGRSNTPMWRDTPANIIGRGAAKSVMRAPPWHRVSNNQRRVGSASAAYARPNTRSSSILLTIGGGRDVLETRYSTVMLNVISATVRKENL